MKGAEMGKLVKWVEGEEQLLLPLLHLVVVQTGCPQGGQVDSCPPGAQDQLVSQLLVEQTTLQILQIKY